MSHADTLPSSHLQTLSILESLSPFDSLERLHTEETIDWVRSGAPLFRIQAPAVPPKHLVSYFLLVDVDAGKVLLVDHRKAGLWLPSGGHVEPGEDPKETVRREVMEELGISAQFLRPDPFFITVTSTVGKGSTHTDVSLWYLLKAKESDPLVPDPAEFFGVRWFRPEEIPYDTADPHMGRCVEKLRDNKIL